MLPVTFLISNVGRAMKFTLKNLGVIALGVALGMIGLNYVTKLVPGAEELASGESSFWARLFG